MYYLKTWMGVTSGTHLGRDDGYPERKFSLIETLDGLVNSYDPSAEYYRLELIDLAPTIQAAKDLIK